MSPQQIWETALSELELELSRANFNTWLRNTKALEKREEVMVVGVPDSFTREWLENKYYDRIITVLRGVSRDIKKIHYEVKTDLFAPALRVAKERRVVESVPPAGNSSLDLSKLQRGGLNPHYTFTNFVVGPFNELAHAAIQGICKNPGGKFNPLFIYGGIGLGKTHLIQAAGNFFSDSGARTKVKYVSADKFSSEYIQAVKSGSIEEFKDSYAKYHVLIIDDVQFLAGKEKSQEVFFHTFNHLYQQNGQIILSSDRPARAIPMLQARLRSRFEGGMTADVAEPDIESRIAILHKKLELKGASLPAEIIETIAANISSNIRELEGVLNTILNHCELTGSTSKEAVLSLIKKLQISSKRTTTFDRIMDVVTQFYNIDRDQLLVATRRKEASFPRQVVMYLLRNELNYSFPVIGRKFGGKDHSTIMYGYKKIEDLVSQSEDFKKEMDVIRDQIYNY